MLTVTPSPASKVAKFKPMDLTTVSKITSQREQTNIRERPFCGSIVTPVDTTAFACNAPYENDSSPRLRPHPRQTTLCHHKLTSGVDLHHLIPIILFNFLYISNSLAEASIGHKYGNGFMLRGDCRILEYGID